MERLERSPPKINPKRKNMSVVSNKAMLLFGQEAFGVQLGENEIEETEAGDKATRLTSQRSSLLKSPMPAKDSQKEVVQTGSSEK